MNNVLHNEVIKILEVALSQLEGTPLNDSVLRDNLLFKFVSESVEQDKKIRAGVSVYQFRKGYIAHIINLGTRLRQLSNSNQKIKSLIEGILDLIQLLSSQIFTKPFLINRLSMQKNIQLVYR